MLALTVSQDSPKAGHASFPPPAEPALESDGIQEECLDFDFIWRCIRTTIPRHLRDVCLYE
jgi:hypothetical protein